MSGHTTDMFIMLKQPGMYLFNRRGVDGALSCHERVWSFKEVDDFILKWWDKIIAGFIALAGAWKWYVSRADVVAEAAIRRIEKKEARLNDYSEKLLEDARMIAQEFREEKNTLMTKVDEYLSQITGLRREVAACREECEHERAIQRKQRQEHQREVDGYRRRIRTLEAIAGDLSGGIEDV